MNQRELFVDMLLRARHVAGEGQEETAQQGAQFFTTVYERMTIGIKQQKSGRRVPKTHDRREYGHRTTLPSVISGPQPTHKAWEPTMQEVAPVMHRSTWSVKQILASMRDQMRLARSGAAGPWTQGRRAATAEQTKHSDQDFVCMPEQYPKPKREETLLHCRKKFGPVAEPRELTPLEWDIMMDIVEGNIVIRRLPQFLRRVCTG